MVLKVGSKGYYLNHNLNLSIFFQLLLPFDEGLSDNLVPGGLPGLPELESVKVIQTVPKLLDSHPLDPCSWSFPKQPGPATHNYQHQIKLGKLIVYKPSRPPSPFKYNPS